MGDAVRDLRGVAERRGADIRRRGGDEAARGDGGKLRGEVCIAEPVRSEGDRAEVLLPLADAVRAGDIVRVEIDEDRGAGVGVDEAGDERTLIQRERRQF